MKISSAFSRQEVDLSSRSLADNENIPNQEASLVDDKPLSRGDSVTISNEAKEAVTVSSEAVAGTGESAGTGDGRGKAGETNASTAENKTESANSDDGGKSESTKSAAAADRASESGPTLKEEMIKKLKEKIRKVKEEIQKLKQGDQENEAVRAQIKAKTNELSVLNDQLLKLIEETE